MTDRRDRGLAAAALLGRQPLPAESEGAGGVKWLIAEYCGHYILMGWHLYLRDDPGYRKRNKDGGWGWIRGPVWERDRDGNKVVAFFAASFGIDLKGDWSCGEYGLADFVKRFPLPGRKVWGERRGGVRVIQGYWSDLTLAPLGGGGGFGSPSPAQRRPNAPHEQPR